MSKKTFKTEIENPALQFVDTNTEKQIDKNHKTPQTNTAKAPTNYKINPIYLETRSKRVQVLMQPSLYEKLKQKAKNEHQSINETIHQLLEKSI